MKYIYLMDISNRLNDYEDRIESFVNGLARERTYFTSISKDMIMRSNLVIAALHNSEIVGVSGLEKKWIFEKSYTMVKNGYQGGGFGTRFAQMKLDEAKKRFHIILSVTKPLNIKAQKLNMKVGYRFIGKRDKHDYFLMPLNMRGVVIHHLVKLIFPLIKRLEKARG